ncbi:MAG TPA: POTRA domain-containing protein [Candidatus Acidoferrum sp.]|nr:POTRA domain-containing protein [Candidatus Acidoferrum sp.]
MRWLATFVCCGSLLAGAAPALAQNRDQPSEAPRGFLNTSQLTIVDELRFAGLRRIAPGAVAAQISSHPGDRFDSAKIDKDVRALAHLGWFESIRVDEVPSTAHASSLIDGHRHIVLIFHLEERPFLSKVEYSGSQLLSRNQIEKLLKDKQLAPGLGKPTDPASLLRIATAIRSNLNELSHPEAVVRVRRSESPDATVTARFEIRDGPLLHVRRVNFTGDPQIRSKLLCKQMREIAPWKPLASWRGKDAYTQEAFEADRRRLLTYYQDHGYPEARIGSALITPLNEQSRKWFPWPHETAKTGLAISIPVQANTYYRFESIGATDALRQAANDRSGKPIHSLQLEQTRPFSQEEIERLRRFWTARIQSKSSNVALVSPGSVAVNQIFSPESHSVRVAFDLSDSPPYTVRRIEFRGLHKFSDRYVRRRIPLREGRPVDEHLLEAGLLRLARTGYFKPIHREDIQVQFDETSHTADVSIRLQEIGQQRASLAGGTGQFGSTLGVVYTVFDLLNREELLSAQLDGGPESLQVMLGLAKEGIFGTRASLAFSVFNNVLRPRFASGVKGPFFTSQSEGVSIPWVYALNNSDFLNINYALALTTTHYPATHPADAPGLTISDVRTKVSSRSVGIGWAHDTGNERALFSNTFSGGLLGGSENMIRTSAEYGRAARDPIFAHANSWAFRTTFSGAGSYRGDMPFYARFFSGDDLVRGFRPGELGPYAETAGTTASGAATRSAAPAGSNLMAAANAEYRIPLAGRTEAAGFFDLGSGRLLPNWLGPTKPLLLSAPNGALHGSTGIELRWTLPGVQVPLRSYYAVNVLRLDRRIRLSDKSLFFARNRFGVFGWGLGSLF